MHTATSGLWANTLARRQHLVASRLHSWHITFQVKCVVQKKKVGSVNYAAHLAYVSFWWRAYSSLYQHFSFAVNRNHVYLWEWMWGASSCGDICFLIVWQILSLCDIFSMCCQQRRCEKENDCVYGTRIKYFICCACWSWPVSCPYIYIEIIPFLKLGFLVHVDRPSLFINACWDPVPTPKLKRKALHNLKLEIECFDLQLQFLFRPRLEFPLSTTRALYTHLNEAIWVLNFNGGTASLFFIIWISIRSLRTTIIQHVWGRLTVTNPGHGKLIN